MCIACHKLVHDIQRIAVLFLGTLTGKLVDRKQHITVTIPRRGLVSLNEVKRAGETAQQEKVLADMLFLFGKIRMRI